MIYTSSKGRRTNYSTLVYSDKDMFCILAVVVVAHVKLKKSQLSGLGGIYGIE